MTQDLFLKQTKPKSKKSQLLEWIKQKHYVKTSEILLWGTQNYSNRASRNARQLTQDGNIRRLSHQEIILHFGKISEAVYEYIKG